MISDAARGTDSSSTSLHTPESAMLPAMFTPTSARGTPPVMSSSHRAAASLFGSPSFQRATDHSAAEDAVDDCHDPENWLPSSHNESDKR
jgi:hypothetical protein